MAADLIVEVAGGALRIAGRFLAEFLLHAFGEVAIQGVGCLICRPFKRDVKPDGWLVTVVGLLFWAAVGVLAYLVYGHLSIPLDG